MPVGVQDGSQNTGIKWWRMSRIPIFCLFVLLQNCINRIVSQWEFCPCPECGHNFTVNLWPVLFLALCAGGNEAIDTNCKSCHRSGCPWSAGQVRLYKSWWRQWVLDCCNARAARLLKSPVAQCQLHYQRSSACCLVEMSNGLLNADLSI